MTINLKDSMSTIQTKLNSSKSIVFTKGTYNITKQLVISNGTVIDLNGATLRRKASIQSIFINKANPSTVKYNGAGDIIIKNGTFEGMGGYSHDNLLTFFHSHNIKIINCIFKDILCHAVEFNSSKDCSVFSCKFLGYNLKDTSVAYKECIQIDHAGYSGFVLSGSTKNSKCYDGTCCDSITITNCTFSKSNYRDYPYACIGEHSQLRGYGKHRNIDIHSNTFECKLNPDLKQACISLTNMENVNIYNNEFHCYKVARIYSKATSYALNGLSVAAGDGDGICKNVKIHHNVIHECKTNKEAFQQYNQSGKTNHENIKKEYNVFE